MSAGGLGMDDSMEETRAVPLRQSKGELNDELDKLQHFFLLLLHFYFSYINE